MMSGLALRICNVHCDTIRFYSIKWLPQCAPRTPLRSLTIVRCVLCVCVCFAFIFYFVIFCRSAYSRSLPLPLPPPPSLSCHGRVFGKRERIAFYSHQNNVIIEFLNAFFFSFLFCFSFLLYFCLSCPHRRNHHHHSSCEDFNRSCHIRLTCANEMMSLPPSCNERRPFKCGPRHCRAVGDGFRSRNTQKTHRTMCFKCYCCVFASGRRRNEPMPHARYYWRFFSFFYLCHYAAAAKIINS